MRRTSRYHALQWIVECQPAGQAFFESIAAFNSQEVAKDYAYDCHRDKQRVGGVAAKYKYRVLERRGSEYVTIARYPMEG